MRLTDCQQNKLKMLITAAMCRPASAGPAKPDVRGGGVRGDRGMAPGGLSVCS